MRKKPIIPVKEDAFDKLAIENLQHLSPQRMKRFLEQAHSLRRNLALRKKQQTEKGTK